MDNKMRLEFLAKSENEGFARVSVSAFIAQLDPTIEELTDIKTAVSEAVTNCIIHGYPNSIGKVYIQGKIVGDKVIIKVRDRGCGIEDISKAMEPLFTTSPSGERAGLGFAVMQELMDKIKVQSRPTVGTIVTMERRITSR